MITFQKIIVNVVLATLCIGVMLVTYWASDRAPPSYFIGAWILTRHIYAGGPISVRFILVRHRLCAKRIEQSIEQDVSQNFPLPARVIEMSELGLDVLTLEQVMPIDVVPGPAEYVATFIWRCPGNFVHWFRPITKTVRLPIEVREKT